MLASTAHQVGLRMFMGGVDLVHHSVQYHDPASFMLQHSVEALGSVDLASVPKLLVVLAH